MNSGLRLIIVLFIIGLATGFQNYLPNHTKGQSFLYASVPLNKENIKDGVRENPLLFHSSNSNGPANDPLQYYALNKSEEQTLTNSEDFISQEAHAQPSNSLMTCTAAFTWDNTDLTIQFTDLSTSTSGNIVSWFWDFDDGSTSTQQNPLHTFPGPDKYDVELEITTDDGCTEDVKIRIEICVLEVTVELNDCNGDGEIPIDINIQDVYDNADEINVFVDGVLLPGSPFDIEAGQPVDLSTTVPGDGLLHTVTVISDDIETCVTEYEFIVEDCSSDCFLSALSIELQQGGSHTVLVGGNFFDPVQTNLDIGDVVVFQWIDGGHSTTSDATSGPDSWNSGVISGPTYEVNLKNPGIHPYYCIPHGGPGGSGMSGSLIADCPGSNNFDVVVSFNTTIADPQGYHILVDGVQDPGGPFDYDGTGPQSQLIQMVGDGLVHEITIEDIADPTCTLNKDFTTPDCGAAPSCQLSLSAQIIGTCDANNEVSVEITVNDIQSEGDNFIVFVNGNQIQTIPYDPSGETQATINIPGNGNANTIRVEDEVNSDCNDEVDLTTPNCNTPCEITNLTATASSGSGGPSGIVHTVLVEDFDFTPQNIDISEGDVIQWEWTGQVAHTSTSDATSGPDSWDSGLLNTGAVFESPVLSEGSHPYYCVPHGAPGGVGMAGTINVLPPCNADGEISVQISFDVDGPGASGYEVLIDGVVYGSFDYQIDNPQVQTIWVIGDNSIHDIQVRDIDEPACSASVDVETPDCGGNNDCSLSLSTVIISGCQANNTVSVELTVEGSNTGTEFEVLLDGNSQGNFSYTGSTTTVEIEVDGDGSSHEITVIDDQDSNCSASENITTPNCNTPCEITNLTATASSGSGGPSGIVHTVLVEDFDFTPQNIDISEGDVIQWEWTGQVAHTSTSDATSGPDSWDSGLLNTGAVFESPVLSEGSHPYYCIPHGAPGGVGMAGTINVLPPCNADGEISVQISFDVDGPNASGYEVLIDGVVYGSFDYQIDNPQVQTIWVIGDNSIHDIQVRDIDEPACSASVDVETPDCGGNNDCSLSLSTEIISGCQANNTVSVQLTVEGSNTGTEFVVLLDGNSQGNFSYTGSTTTIEIEVDGDGSSHEITVIDDQDSNCSASENITTPNCNTPCEISNLEIIFNQATTHVIEVLDFEFLPKDITIALGDTLRFEWIGQIPHTVTSDAPSGPNSFQSGLQSQGYVYELVLSGTGSFPYYCEPHGAPGGIGMAGTIEVQGNCENGMVPANFSFTQSGGSDGYEIWIDDSLFTPDPIPYVSGSHQTFSLLIQGDGEEHSFEVRDHLKSNCNASIEMEVPDCSEDENCSLDIASIDLTECEEGQFTVHLDLIGSNTGDFFEVLADGNTIEDSIPYNSDGLTSISFELTGNGAEREISIRDLEFPSCFIVDTIEAPECGVPCFITTIEEDQSNKVTVLVRDFDFFPQIAEVFSGDTIEFVWTGEVPHTSTSDAISGQNSWDSGLLSQGDTFQLIIDEPGTYPYYCIPHGGPGGIGMAGQIVVKEQCEGDFWQTEINFNVTMGSPLGYNYFIDGVKQNDIPLNYDDPKGENSLQVSLPGDGETHLITIQDVETTFCAATVFVTSSICGAGCSISDLQLNTNQSITHTVEVRDFDYLPEELEIRAGQRVLFDFTGSIPHTVTSDRLIGLDVWDSGLLGQGSQFEIQIKNPGEHPYYCIPHGGPGGIGMSGLITASPACINGMVPLQINFHVSNGSPMGYRLFIDGELWSSTPFIYQNPKGENHLTIDVPGDGLTHIITIQDMENPICAASSFIEFESCQDSCEMEFLSLDYGNPSVHKVAVRDFDFAPEHLISVQGDSIEFIWEGEIPHTVTSDDQSTSWAFNSGLLGQGSSFKIQLDSVGSYPYYCIPHGAPNGVGMAGMISVEELCYNDSLNMKARFSNPVTSGQYEVFLDGVELADSPFEYHPSGTHSFNFPIRGDGATHQLQINDLNNAGCSVIEEFQSPDCSDPCIALIPDFSSNIDFASRKVTFSNQSLNATGWLWDFDDGNTSVEENPTHTYAEEGTYFVCLTVFGKDNCEKQFCDKITLGGIQCNSDFTISNEGLQLSLENQSQVNGENISIEWSMGDGTFYRNMDQVSHTYSDLGIYEICLVISSDQCSDTLCQLINLTNPCHLMTVDFSHQIDPENPLNITFEESIGGSPTNILWGFGDGLTSLQSNPNHTYQSEGIYTVCLFVQDNNNSCNKSICKEIEVGNVTNTTPVSHFKPILVFPNPSNFQNQLLYISGLDRESPSIGLTYQIFDLLGKEVERGRLQPEETTLLNHNLEAGAYLLIIHGTNNSYHSKIIITD